MSWAREAAVEIHSDEADKFAKWYQGEDPFSDVFLYGRAMCEPFLTRELAKLSAEARILDVGCGTGEQLSRLLNQGRDVVGIEPAPGMLRYCEARCPGRVTRGSVLELPFENESFEFVMALEVLRYLDAEDNDLALSEIYRVLRPGGTFFGTFVNLWALDFYYLFYQIQKLTDGRPNHVTFETPGSLGRRLQRAGLMAHRTHGAMFAFLRVIQKLGGPLWKLPARILAPLDRRISDLRPLRPLAGHLIGIAQKP